MSLDRDDENIEWGYTFVEVSSRGYAIAGATYIFEEDDDFDCLLVRINEQSESKVSSGVDNPVTVPTNVEVIPEFPSWIVLPLFLATTLFVLIIRKKIF